VEVKLESKSGLPVELGGEWSLDMHEIAWFQNTGVGGEPEQDGERYRVVRLAISHGCRGPDGPRAVVCNSNHCARCMEQVPADVTERALWHARRLGHLLLGYQVQVRDIVVGP